MSSFWPDSEGTDPARKPSTFPPDDRPTVVDISQLTLSHLTRQAEQLDALIERARQQRAREEALVEWWRSVLAGVRSGLALATRVVQVAALVGLVGLAMGVAGVVVLAWLLVP